MHRIPLVALILLIASCLYAAWRALIGDCCGGTRFVRWEADFNAIGSALKTYKMNSGRYPTTEQGLKVLVEQPLVDPKPKRWVQVLKKLPQDPWGNEYQYRAPAVKNPENFELWSYGKDGRPRTSDDVSSLKSGDD